MRGKGIRVFRYKLVAHDHPSRHSCNKVGLRGPTFINFNLKPLLPTYLHTAQAVNWHSQGLSEVKVPGLENVTNPMETRSRVVLNSRIMSHGYDLGSLHTDLYLGTISSRVLLSVSGTENWEPLQCHSR